MTAQWPQLEAYQQAMAAAIETYLANKQASCTKMTEWLEAMTTLSKPITQLGGSFTLATSPTPHRLVVGIDGLEKVGKSQFALSAPGPMAYQNLDIGLEGVIQKHQTSKEIWLAEYGILVEKGDDQQALMLKAAPEFERFVKDWRETVIPGFKSGKLRTGVWDTGTELWELQRMARLGKLTQVMPHHYTALNSEYTNLVREVFETSGNLIILHKLKQQWTENALGKATKSGNYDRSGFSGTGFLVQVNATVWRERLDTDTAVSGPTGPFHLTVRDCRQNPALAGLDLVDEMATFPWLAVNVYPDTDLDDWV